MDMGTVFLSGLAVMFALILLLIWLVLTLKSGIAKILAAVIIVILISLLSFWLFGPQYSEMREGDKVIAKIETFRQIEGRLPESLDEIGIPEKMTGPFYYQKRSTSTYKLYFSRAWTVGESVTYNSDLKKWDW